MACLRTILLTIARLVGYIWQLYYIIAAYFAYQNVTEITNILPTNFKPPALVFCVDSELSFQKNSKTESVKSYWKDQTAEKNSKAVLDQFHSFANNTDLEARFVLLISFFHQEVHWKMY